MARLVQGHAGVHELIPGVLQRSVNGTFKIGGLKRREFCARRSRANQQSINFDHAGLAALVSRIEVLKNRLVISLWPTDQSIELEVISVAGQKTPSMRSRGILLPHGTFREYIRPERAERRARQAQSPAPNNSQNVKDAPCAKSI